MTLGGFFPSQVEMTIRFYLDRISTAFLIFVRILGIVF